MSMLQNNTKGDSASVLSATARAAEVRSSLDALHEPDNVVGGYFDYTPSRMGLSSVNKAIGGAWPRRVAAID